jgi:enoyl-CoA hydratase
MITPPTASERATVTDFSTIAYRADDGIATITLNRPHRLNTIVPPMPDELGAAVDLAVRDTGVKVIVLRGAGRSFCAGFDFGGGFRHWDDLLYTDGKWDPGKEFIAASSPTLGWAPKFMSLWHSPKPVIAEVHGWAVGGGSEMALCADLVVMSEDAVIGTPYSRMWGCHFVGMWVYRLGLTKAKEYALTGKAITGVEAAALELVNEAVPFDQLEQRVYEAAQQLMSIPLNQLTAMKLVINQAYENMGLTSSRLVGGLLDGMLRNTPEALEFIEYAGAEGVPAAVARRDGPFGDYSQGRTPDPEHVNDVTPRWATGH